MDIRHQIGKTIAYKASNKASTKANKVGKESNPLSGKVLTCDPYVISEQEAKRYCRQTYVISGAYLISHTLCDF